MNTPKIKEYVDVIVRHVKNYGYLPIVSVDGVEFYRGDFKKTATDAFNHGHQVATAIKYVDEPRLTF